MRWGRTISKRRLAAKLREELEPKGAKLSLASALDIQPGTLTRAINLGSDPTALLRIAAHYGYVPQRSEVDMFVAVETREVA